ncbi:MAG: sugar kinase [Anaerolineales bacterium]|jgi:sugar/nucleoside kinase (ribokinase family)
MQSPSSRPYDVLVAGEINPDLILNGDVVPRFGQLEQLVDSATLSIGSSSAIFSCGTSRLGLKTAFIGVCGDDLFGHFMLEEMTRRQVDVSPVIVDQSGQTGLSVNLNRGNDRAILTLVGCMASLRADQVPDSLLAKARHVHVASYFLQTALKPGLPDLFRRARALGLSVSLDPNFDPSGEWRGFDELLSLVDVFLPNQREALGLTGTATAEQALAALARKCPTVAVKLGEEGAIAARGAETARAAAIQMEVVDTVGAGDSFDGGFLYAWLNGWNLERGLRLAVACGSLSTRSAGGTTGQATLEEVLPFVG